jgi:hypothetical protein
VLGLLAGFLGHRLLWGPSRLATPLAMILACLGACLGSGALRWAALVRCVPVRIRLYVGIGTAVILVSTGSWLPYRCSTARREMRAAQELSRHAVILYSDELPGPDGQPRVVRDPAWDGWRRELGLATVDTVEFRVPGIPKQAWNFRQQQFGSAPGINMLKPAPLPGPPLDDPVLELLTPLTSVRRLSLHNCRLSNRGLAPLASLKRLQSLWISYTEVSDEALVPLAELRGLRVLGLCQTPITDRGLERLANLTNLRELHLANTAITDDGLPHLRRLQQLEALTLADTRVSAAGLSHIAALRNLREIRLNGCGIAPSGLEVIRKELPNARVTL